MLLFPLFAGTISSLSSFIFVPKASLYVSLSWIPAVYNSGLGFMLVHLQPVLSIIMPQGWVRLDGLSSQSFSLFQSGCERSAKGLRQQQRQHSNNKRQDSHDELHRGQYEFSK